MNITVKLSPKLRLEQALKKSGIENPAIVERLAISGRLTDDDMTYVRENMAKTLLELDLSKALFKKNIIPHVAFEGCIALTNVSFPDTIIEIGRYSFKNCIGLTSINIPASLVMLVDYIDDIYYDFWAFEGCTGLTRIDVHPDNPVFASDDGVLLNKEKTKIIKCPYSKGDFLIPDTVVEVERFPFIGCKGLTSITVSQNHPEFSSVDGVLFNKDKTSLIRCPEGRQGDYVIPETVVKVHSAFCDCVALTSIHIPASVVEIGWVNEITARLSRYEITVKEEKVFCTCTGLISITAASDNPLYASIDGVLFNKDKTELIVYPKGRQGDYVIPASVCKIRARAFSDCVGLTSIAISASVTEIGNYAFKNCTGLTSVIIPASVTKLAGGVFWDCTALTSIVIPNSVKTIGNFLFRDCTALTSVLIPASVEDINVRGNVFHNCPAIVAVHPDNPYFTVKDGILSYRDDIFVSGRAGELDWTFSGDTLTISNEIGKSSPWYIFRKIIKKIVLKGELAKNEHLFSDLFQAWD